MAKQQNAYTVARHVKELAKHAKTTDFTTPAQDTALASLTEWLSETRTLAAFDAWMAGEREAAEKEN